MKDGWRERFKKRGIRSAWCFMAGLAVIMSGMYLWFGLNRVMWIGCLGCTMAMGIGPLVVWGSIEDAWETLGDYRWERARHARWASQEEAE